MSEYQYYEFQAVDRPLTPACAPDGAPSVRLGNQREARDREMVIERESLL